MAAKKECQGHSRAMQWQGLGAEVRPVSYGTLYTNREGRECQRHSRARGKQKAGVAVVNPGAGMGHNTASRAETKVRNSQILWCGPCPGTHTQNSLESREGWSVTFIPKHKNT